MRLSAQARMFMWSRLRSRLLLDSLILALFGLVLLSTSSRLLLDPQQERDWNAWVCV